MAKAKTVGQLRLQLETLRRDTLDAVAAANKIVYRGVYRVADHELKVLSETYRMALDALKKNSADDSSEASFGKKIEVLQEAGTRLIGSARDAMAIVAEASGELNQLMRKSLKGAKADLAKAERTAERARKTVEGVRKAAADGHTAGGGRSTKTAGGKSRKATTTKDTHTGTAAKSSSTRPRRSATTATSAGRQTSKDSKKAGKGGRQSGVRSRKAERTRETSIQPTAGDMSEGGSSNGSSGSGSSQPDAASTKDRS